MAVSTTKENIFTKFGAFISRIWHSISNFFKPDNIEEVPVSSLSTYLRTHLKFIENIIAHYKPGQKGGISFDAPIQTAEIEKEDTEKAAKVAIKQKSKFKESAKAKKVQTAKTLDSNNVVFEKVSAQKTNSTSKTVAGKDTVSPTSKKENVENKQTTSRQEKKEYGDLDRFTDILKGKNELER